MARFQLDSRRASRLAVVDWCIVVVMDEVRGRVVCHPVAGTMMLHTGIHLCSVPQWVLAGAAVVVM